MKKRILAIVFASVSAVALAVPTAAAQPVTAAGEDGFCEWAKVKPFCY